MLKTIKCKNCGASSYKKISNDTYECKYCGMQVRKKNVKCDECERKNIDYLENETIENEKQDIDKYKNKKNFALVKLMLCIFLGHFGVHRFIEGKIFTGLIYCFTSGLFGIGVIVDIIRIAKELSGIKIEDEE